MLKISVSYAGFDGEISKDLYFNLYKTELLSIDERNSKDYSDYLKKTIKEKDAKAIINVIKDLILLAYGERSGDEFVKSPEIKEGFKNSLSFYALLDLFMDNPEEFNNFAKNLIPGGLDSIKEDMSVG